jgi:hypothetical protein
MSKNLGGLAPKNRVWVAFFFAGDELRKFAKNSKAAGIEDITAGHLKFIHPTVIVILAKLFIIFFTHGYIPLAFGLIFTVPIIDRSG